MLGRATTHTTDAGSRYRVTISFARDLDAEAQAGVHSYLESATVSGRDTRDTIDTRELDVSADRAVVTFDLPMTDDRAPTDIRGALNGAVAAWHRDHAPLGPSTRAGGDPDLTSLDATRLEADREPDENLHTYLIAYPDRPLIDEEVALLEHVTDETAIVTPGAVALADAVSVVPEYPARPVLQQLRDSLIAHVDAGHDLRTRSFWGEREVGTLATVEGANDVLAERARQQSPHAPADDADSDAEVGEV